MPEFKSIDCPMSMFSELELIAVNAAAERHFNAGAEGFAYLIGQMAESELQRRAWNVQHPHASRPARTGSIRLDQWSDKDIGDALILCWGMAEHTVHPKVGELFDALGDAFCEIAADRLRNSSDARNATTFIDRNLLGRGEHVDPEAN